MCLSSTQKSSLRICSLISDKLQAFSLSLNLLQTDTGEEVLGGFLGADFVEVEVDYKRYNLFLKKKSLRPFRALTHFISTFHHPQSTPSVSLIKILKVQS